MQRIYNDGKERIETGLPDEWRKPVKKLNFRCPKRIVRLINRIREDVDGQQQEPISTAIEGLARLFILPAVTSNKPAAEDHVRHTMAEFTSDPQWNDRNRCKILMLEHHMAAKRMGFQDLFDSLYEVEDFRTGLLDGTLPATRLFAATILSVVRAYQAGDKFLVAKIVRESSPILSESALKESSEPRKQLQAAKQAVENLMALWNEGEPTCGKILESVAATGLFVIPDSLKAVLALEQIRVSVEDSDRPSEIDQLPDRLNALAKFLDTPFSQVLSYSQYISEDAPYDTHQGVKGREFERVMVLMDQTEVRGFMFDYEKLFGAKELSPTDVRNQQEGKDSSLDRTRRLFYVTCSRAQRSLAVVAYSESPQAVKQSMIANGWFDESEIVVS
jgi:DNA helicase-2/ATP-dependent DNA helicase PcrA